MIVVFTEEAEADLERIGDYIARDNPRRAATFVNELVERCQNLTAMPLAFPLISRHEESGIRRRPFGNYVIFYRPGPDRIDLLHVLNAAQDFEAILFERN